MHLFSFILFLIFNFILFLIYLNITKNLVWYFLVKIYKQNWKIISFGIINCYIIELTSVPRKISKQFLFLSPRRLNALILRYAITVARLLTYQKESHKLPTLHVIRGYPPKQSFRNLILGTPILLAPVHHNDSAYTQNKAFNVHAHV